MYFIHKARFNPEHVAKLLIFETSSTSNLEFLLKHARYSRVQRVKAHSVQYAHIFNLCNGKSASLNAQIINVARPRRDRWMLMPQVLLQKARLPRNSILRISYRICIIQEGKASLLKPNQKRKTHRYCHNWTNQGYPSINTFRFLVPSLQIASTLFSGGVSF